MGNFNKFDKDRGSKGFGGGRKFSAKSGPSSGWGGRSNDRYNDGPKQMFPATCSECRQNCEVPFKPTGDRPVFCSNCFKKQGGPSPRFAPKSFGGHKPEFRPVHGASNNAGAGGAVSRAQLDSLNAKLDKILAILNPTKAKTESEIGALETTAKAGSRLMAVIKVKKIKAPIKKFKTKKK